MSSHEKQIPLKGSTRHRMPSAQVSGAVPQGEFQVTVMVRRQKALPDATEHSKMKLKDRSYMSRESLATTYGASSADLAKVTEFAKVHHLKVRPGKTARHSFRHNRKL